MVSVFTGAVSAAPAYTPYANSVAETSGTSSGQAENAVGAPDGSTANAAGVNASMTLDMGDGEEGTNTLLIHLGQVGLQASVQVSFLDDSKAVISQETRPLFLGLTASTQTFTYDWHTSGKAYRFVRISSVAAIGLNIDAVEALGFIGSSPTQDTDGDGTPDRIDGDPLVFNSKPSTGGEDPGDTGHATPGSTPSTGGPLTSNNGTVVRTTAGPTNVVNAPSSVNDKDGDQIDDTWERDHGLDPNNKDDAASDIDKDGLTAAQEYQVNTDPRNHDTDGDRMPDGWEVDNALNALVQDAEQDPDGDYLTNLGEMIYEKNPWRADDIRLLASNLRQQDMIKSMFWPVLLVIVLIVLVGGLRKVVLNPAIKKNKIIKRF